MVTLGAGGALWSDGEALQHAVAPPVPSADTTGAGDAFAAGCSPRGWTAPPRLDALRAGCALAAGRSRATGGR